jgi:hypothetical protein
VKFCSSWWCLVFSRSNHASSEASIGLKHWQTQNAVDALLAANQHGERAHGRHNSQVLRAHPGHQHGANAPCDDFSAPACAIVLRADCGLCPLALHTTAHLPDRRLPMRYTSSSADCTLRVGCTNTKPRLPPQCIFHADCPARLRRVCTKADTIMVLDRIETYPSPRIVNQAVQARTENLCLHLKNPATASSLAIGLPRAVF